MTTKTTSQILPEQMAAAAVYSLNNAGYCMFCGPTEAALHVAEDWDGNRGRACETCDPHDDEDDA